MHATMSDLLLNKILLLHSQDIIFTKQYETNK